MSSAHLRLSRVSSAIAIAFALAAAPAAAAGYLKLGDIKGQAAAAGSGHRDEIHIESFSWGATQARVGGKMHQEDLSVAPSKDGAKGGNVEFEWKVEEGESAPPGTTGPTTVASKGSTPTGRKATPKLLEAAVKGKVFKSPTPRGSLTTVVPAGTCRAGARYPTAELGTGNRVYTMTGVVVAGCSAAGSSGRPMETLSLNYEKIVWK
jgi:type VI protein secretion system component Hcp